MSKVLSMSFLNRKNYDFLLYKRAGFLVVLLNKKGV
jgi:hypothetical protein